MPKFKSQCASQNLHEQWNCDDDDLHIRGKLPHRQTNKLLELAGKKMKDFHKASPKFCENCIEKLLEFYPELASGRSRSNDDNEDNICAKRVKLSDSEEPTQSFDLPHTLGSEQKPSIQNFIDLNAINFDGVSQEKKAELAYMLGLSVKKDIKNNCIALGRDRSLPAMLKLQPVEYIKDMNPVLTSFVKGVHGLDENYPDTGDQSDYKIYKLCKILESLMHLSSPTTLLPLHFRESVLLYTMTGSRLALKTIGTGGPHCSYQSVKVWLDSLSTEETKCPTGDSIIAFDNNQILQRRWRVKLENKVHCHVVTIIVNFELHQHGSLQYNSPTPSEWMTRKLTNTECQYIKYIDMDSDIKEVHYAHLCSFLKEQIEIVSSQQQLVASNYRDTIDDDADIVKRAAEFKLCYNCHADKIPRKKLTCPNCKASLTKASMKAMGLDDAGNLPMQEPLPSGSKHDTTKEKRVILVKKEADDKYHVTYEKEPTLTSNTEISELPSVSVQKPVEVNPCSYDAVRTVLRTIGQISGIKQYGTGERKWIIVLCDGVPYNLCRRVIACSHLCSKCNKAFNGLDEFTKHQNEVHGVNEEISCELEFGWVLLQPGPGHIEMNMVKGFVELSWDIFWKELALLMNFRSDAALHSAKKVNDHHKGWTLCRIARTAITQELLVPFVRTELSSGEQQLSASKFLKYVMKSSNPNYGLMCDLIFEILDAIFLYRVGQRSGMSKLMISGRAKVAKLWSGRIHPLYRELEMADTIAYMRMPDDIRLLIQDSMSLNLTGKENTGEGADFRLEEVNRHVQQWLPANPTLADWQTACSNHDKLREFRDTVFMQQGAVDPKSSGSHTSQNIDREVQAFRIKLRSHDYLTCPTTVRSLTSLTGNPLDEELQYFCTKSREKRAQYFNCYQKHELTSQIMKSSPPSFLERPVFITKEDRENYSSIENMKVHELNSLIEDKLMTISDTDMRQEMHNSWKKMKRGKKNDIIDFYLELDEYVQNEEFYMNILDNGESSEEHI